MEDSKMKVRPKVVIESPFRAGQGFTQSENEAFAMKLCELALSKGMNPFAMHLFFPRFLSDNSPGTRNHGIRMGMEWGMLASEAWFCLRPSENLTEGMTRALHFYKKAGIPCYQIRLLKSAQILDKVEIPDEPS